MEQRVAAGYAVEHPRDVRLRVDVAPREVPGVEQPLTLASEAMVRLGDATRKARKARKASVELARGSTATREIGGKVVAGVAWRRWLPDGATRAQIAAAIAEHVGEIDGDDGLNEMSPRYMAIDPFYHRTRTVMGFDGHGSVAVAASDERC